MQIRFVLVSSLLLLGLGLRLQAQEANPAKRQPPLPQLTMEDLENRVAMPVLSSREIPAPATSKAADTNKNTQTLPDAQARAIVEAAWKKTAAAKSGRMQYTNQSAEGVHTMFYEFGAVDRGRIVTEREEVIVIGQTAYVNEGGKGWKKTTKEEHLKSADIPFRFFPNYSFALTTQVQFVGEEMIEKMPMLKFKISESDGLSQYTWVRKNDGFVHKVEASLANPKRFLQAVYFDFNATIPIVPPRQ